MAPRTPTEQALAEIWCEVLGLRQVGIHDNFFEMGGHSLLVAQVISRVRQSFRVELPMRRLFEAPVISHLAALIEEIIIQEVTTLDEPEVSAIRPFVCCPQLV